MNKEISKVLWKKQLKPSIGIMGFSFKNIDFKPGQFYNIKILKEEMLMRPYSVCSTTKDDHLEFYIKAHPDGKVAKHILALKGGDEVQISGPYGSFVLKDNDKEIYFISAGSGIAPLIGMARQLAGSNRKITFLHGDSYHDQCCYHEELEKMKGENFSYVLTISRPEENLDWKGKTGRVENLLHECVNTDAEAYICGPPPMVVEAEKQLLEKGFSKDNIFTEQYY